MDKVYTNLDAKKLVAKPLTRAWANAYRLILVIFVLWVSTAGQAASYSEIIGKHLELTQGDDVDVAPTRAKQHNGLVLAVATIALALGVIVPRVRGRFNLRSPANPFETLPVEDATLTAFFTELRDGLNASTHQSVAPVINSLNGAQPCMATDPVGVVIESAPGRIAAFRTLFSEISRAPDAAARQRSLLEFADQVRSLKESSRMPALHPVWLLASALEGLLKQLSREASDFTPSAQRTAAGAVDLIETLCVRGLNPNLATEPPVRILAVDDDAVSRLAISFALKKAFNEPNLAPEGVTALALAMQHCYDVIFLDVEMPGMDGFELCTKIHETVRNRTTPIVFVTRHSDFNSRAKSSVSGGRDLIAKPYLAFEITVKALTLALRARFLNGAAEPVSVNKAALVEARSEKTPKPVEAPAASAPPFAPVATPSVEEKQQVCDRSAPVLKTPSHDEGADSFFDQTLPRLEELRNRLEAARNADGPAELQKSLSLLYTGVHSLCSEAERAELRAILKLGSALEGMLMKLLKHTKFCAPSTLDATGAALELLEDLCLAEVNPDLAHPPIRLLVVDDDPIARRAISGSLQLAFGRPDSADSGEQALTLVADNRFDLIFLDVLMPGLDGFTTCAKIHETASNRHTPIVFVTSHDDLEARSQAAAAGGCGFIPKPVLPSQITLTALTFIMRARLDDSNRPTPSEELAGLVAT